MPTLDRPARAAGALYLLTHVTSVAALVLYGRGVLDTQARLGDRNSLLIGAGLEVLLAVAVVGTAVALYPALRRYSPVVAAGDLALRTLEAAVMLMGVVLLLPVVASPGISDPSLLNPEVGKGLLIAHQWTFLVGPGLVVPWHTLLLAALVWRSRLAPRWIPALGLVGAILIAAMNGFVMAGLAQAVVVAALPIFAWEVAWALHLLLRGWTGPDTPPAPAGAAALQQTTP